MEKPQKNSPGRTFQKAAILIVHSNKAQLDWLDNELTGQGHTVFTAENGDQALEMMAACMPDLVFMGADPNALKVLEQIKANDAQRHIPVLIAPDPEETDKAVAFMEAGAADWLILPVPPGLLHGKIGACLDYYRLKKLEKQYFSSIDKEKQKASELYNLVVPAGVALSAEKDFARLLERVLLEAKRLCNADGGTLYLKTDADKLEFMMFHNDSMEIRQGGATDQPIRFPPLSLYNPDTGGPNHGNIATFAALTGKTLNIADAYQAVDFDFSGTRRFDQANGYRSMSFLTVPLQNAHGRTLGVLQLVNAQDRETGQVVPFAQSSQDLIESFAMLAAMAIESYDRTQGLRQELQNLKAELEQVRQQV